MIEYITKLHVGRLSNASDNYYFVGLIDLAKTYPHTLVQPETIELKIQDLFSKRDTDFKSSKKFSRKFQVDTKDKDALEMLVFNKDLDRIADHPSAEFELNEKECYFRASVKPVSIEEAEDFVDLAKILLEVF